MITFERSMAIVYPMRWFSVIFTGIQCFFLLLSIFYNKSCVHALCTYLCILNKLNGLLAYRICAWSQQKLSGTFSKVSKTIYFFLKNLSSFSILRQIRKNVIFKKIYFWTQNFKKKFQIFFCANRKSCR